MDAVYKEDRIVECLPPKCVFPFTYKGVSYDTCITLGFNKYWCSDEKEYNGKYSICEDFLEGGASNSTANKKPLSCSSPGNPANPCDGLTCTVNDVGECEQIMKDKSCGVAVYTPVKNQTDLYQCKMVLKRDQSLPADSSIHFKPNVEQILYFKMYSGVPGGPDAADAFLTAPTSSEIRFPRTKATSFSTGKYYKSSLWNIRDQLGASTVTVAMFGNLGNDGSDSCELTFANTKSANGGWFNKDNLIASFPANVFQLKSLNPHGFSINGVKDSSVNRQFYFMQHGGCPMDIGPISVIGRQDPCSWGNSPLPLPRFICAAAWNPDAPQTPNEPNMNSRGRFMKELEVTGRLFRPINILYVGPKDS
jgi:hypothetical protein